MADENKKKVLIVGATRGLGKALAEDYVEHGWQVYGMLQIQSTHWSYIRYSDPLTPLSRHSAL